MNKSHRVKFSKVFGVYVLLTLSLFVYVRFSEDALTSENYSSFLLNPLFGYAMVSIGIAALLCYIWSFYILAKGKGYSAWLTLLAGFSLIGLLILLFLPNKNTKKN